MLDSRSWVPLTEILSYSAGVKLAGVIYIHKISDDRFGGLAVQNFRMFRELCGERTLKNVVLMTNMWGRVTPQQGRDREQQLKDNYFQAAIAKGAQLCRHNNTPESARAILRKILQNKPVALRIQRELIDEQKDIGQTRAGAELNREIYEIIEEHKKEIRGLEETMRKAIEEKDEETQQELDEERRKMQEVVMKLQKESKEMVSRFEESRHEMEERINAVLRVQVGVHEEYEEELRRYEEKVRELERGGRENTSQIEYLKGKIAELRKKVEEGWKCTVM